MKEILTAIIMLLGAVFLLLASIGIVRMPDLLTRMQTASKATALGTGLIFIAVAVHAGELGVATRAVAGFAFMVLTAPVAAHMIGRAGYLAGASLTERTVADELRGRYDRERHTLASTGTPPGGEPARE